MTTKRKTLASKGAAKKLKLRRETLKNLDVTKKTGAVKGGQQQEPWGTISAKCTRDIFCPSRACP